MEVLAPSTSPPSLPSLPLDVIEAVGSRLSFKDRLRLASCCRGLWLREDIASSTALWGDLLVCRASLLAGRQAALAAWLAKRRQGVVRLQLRLSVLPPELGSLTQLLALDVGSNQGLGEAPASPGAAASASHDATASAALDAALSALQPLSRLTRLDLSWCRLQRVPSFLSAFASLADLSLDVNGSLGEGGDRSFLPLQRGAPTALRRLGLSYCRLYALPSFLAGAPQLADLCLNSNMALGDGSLGQLRGCSMLTLLHMRECGLHAVPKELSDLPLAELDLSWNTQLGRGHEAATCRALANLGASLTRLDLGKCFLERLPPQVSCLRALCHLGLWNNWSLGQGGEWHDRFEGLGHLTRLTHLGLGICGLEQVPKEVAALSRLAHLDLSSNRLGGGGPAALQPLMPLRHALTYLNLQSCGLESVPAQLFVLVSLVHLDFSGNEISQAAGAEGAQALQSLTQLTHLDMTCCNLPWQLLSDS